MLPWFAEWIAHLSRMSGKSVTAERLLAARDRVDYVATGPVPDASDPEWADRVRLHRQRRPAHWTTLETLDLESVLSGSGTAPLLVDCLSTWLAANPDAVLADNFKVDDSIVARLQRWLG